MREPTRAGAWRRAVPWAVPVGFAFVYALLPSANHTGDGTLFADVVRHFGDAPSAELRRLLLHPHHLLYGPLALGLMHLPGPPPQTPYPEVVRLGLLSALLGAGALATFQALLRRAAVPPALAASFTALLGGSAAFWYFSTSVEVQALALLAAALFLAALTAPPGDAGAARLGAAHGLAIGAHLLNVLLAIPAARSLWNGRRPPARRLVLYAGFLAVVAGVPYLAALAANGVGTPAQAVDYFRPPEPARYLSGPAPLAVLRSLEGVFLGPPLDRTPAAWEGAWWSLRLLLPAALLLPLLRRRGDPLPEAACRLRRGAWWMLACYAPLWLLWDSGNPEFLVLGTPAVFALLATSHSARPAARAALPLALAALLLAGYHLGARAIPLADPGRNLPLRQTAFLRDHTGPRDVILISGVGEYRVGKFYLRYFGERRRLVLDWALLGTGSPDRAVEEMRRDIARALREGSRVLVTSELFDPATARLLSGRHRFEAAHGAALLAGLERHEVGRGPGGMVLWELRPRAPA